jgi:Tfp pilus assembly protein FimT
MKIKSSIKSLSRYKGITLIEILLIISLIAVLVSFAIPTIGSAAARAEMTAAVESVQFSINAARDVARMTGSDVSLKLESTPDDQLQRITFSAKGAAHNSLAGGLQQYQLPEDIRLISQYEIYVFDDRGLVDTPGEMILVSRLDDSISSKVRVE